MAFGPVLSPMLILKILSMTLCFIWSVCLGLLAFYRSKGRNARIMALDGRNWVMLWLRAEYAVGHIWFVFGSDSHRHHARHFRPAPRHRTFLYSLAHFAPLRFAHVYGVGGRVTGNYRVDLCYLAATY